MVKISYAMHRRAIKHLLQLEAQTKVICCNRHQVILLDTVQRHAICGCFAIEKLTRKWETFYGHGRLTPAYI